MRSSLDLPFRREAAGDDEPLGKEVLNRRGDIEGGVLQRRTRHRRSEHEPVGERCSECEGSRVEPPPSNAVVGAADLEPGAAAREIDRRYLILLVRLPDRVDRPTGGEVT